MPMDIIARGMASKAQAAAQKALDELAKTVEGRMNEDETVFTDLNGNVVTPNEDTVYFDVDTFKYYRWDGSAYYTVSDSSGNVKYTPQDLSSEEKEQARSNIGAQKELESGVNIKTINGLTVLGEGNLPVRTYQAFNPSWPTNTTILALAQAINNDANAEVGMAYLGEVSCSGLPFGGNAELRVEILNKSGNQKIMLFTLTSSNVFPYHWEATCWSSGLTQWRGFSENAVLYTAQNLTNAQKEQARVNIGVETAFPYIVDYNNPNFDEITTAFNAGRIVVLKGANPDPNSYALVNYVSASYITFSKFLTSRHSTKATLSTYYLKPDNTWDTAGVSGGGRNVLFNTVNANQAIGVNDPLLTALEVGGVNYALLSRDSQLINDRYVRYDAAQSLTAAQKDQVRANIGATSCRTGTRALEAANWNNDKELLLTISGVTTNDYIHIIGSSSADEALLAQYGIGYAIVAGGILFNAEEIPESDINLQIAIITGTAL